MYIIFKTIPLKAFRPGLFQLTWTSINLELCGNLMAEACDRFHVFMDNFEVCGQF